MYEIDGIRFYDAGPQAYLIGQPSWNEEGFAKFCSEMEIDTRSDQFTGAEAENVIEAAGRGCYLSYGTGRPHVECIQNMRDMDHGSVFQHQSVTVIITGVSRGLTHELVRHNVGNAMSQTSSRYVEASKLGFVIPPEFRDSPTLRRGFEDHCLNALGKYEASLPYLVEALELEHPTTQKTAIRKMARGAARAMLPINLAQIITFSFNAHSARHFLRMRGNRHADIEIRELALVLAPVFKTVWPALNEDVHVEDGEVKLGWTV